LPIVLVRIDELEDAGIVGEMLRAHEYWRLKGLAVDLVILNEHGASYAQDLQIAIETQMRIRQSRVHPGVEREPGGVLLLRSDRLGEILYVRDLENGDLWSPTALPIRHERARYIVRHGRGYSRFEVTANGITLELLQYVALGDPIKISRFTLRNVSGRPRRLSVTAYVEWVLGLARPASPPTSV